MQILQEQQWKKLCFHCGSCASSLYMVSRLLTYQTLLWNSSSLCTSGLKIYCNIVSIFKFNFSIRYSNDDIIFTITGQMVLSNEKLLALCEKYLIVHCKVLRDLLDFHPFSFIPFIRMTIEFVLHYLFQPENQVLLFDSFVVQCLNLVKAIILTAEYKPAKVFEGIQKFYCTFSFVFLT